MYVAHGSSSVRTGKQQQRWKLVVFDPIIRSKLLYGLETIHVTRPFSKKLDAFQFRCIRKILGMSPTSINRANTNNRLLETATAIAFPAYGDRRIASLSEYHMSRRAKLLEHALRSNNDDPLGQFFLPHFATTVEYGERRCGRPRQNWLRTTKNMFTNIHWAILITMSLCTKTI